MRLLISLALLFLGCSTLSAQVTNPCGTEAVCKPTWKCVEHFEKQMTWTNFGIWLNAHQGYDYEVYYANATYVWFNWVESCALPTICYDNEGECQ